METSKVFEELLKPWIHAVLIKTATTTSTWTGITGRAHLWAQSRILSQPKRSREKNTLPWITSEIIHALGEKEAACSTLKKSPTDYQQQKYRDMRAKAKTLIGDIYFSSLDSDLARQPKRFWSFFKLKKKNSELPWNDELGRWESAGPSSINASTDQRAV